MLVDSGVRVRQIGAGDAKCKRPVKAMAHCRSELLPAISWRRAGAPIMTCRKHTKLCRCPIPTATNIVESRFGMRILGEALLKGRSLVGKHIPPHLVV